MIIEGYVHKWVLNRKLGSDGVNTKAFLKSLCSFGEELRCLIILDSLDFLKSLRIKTLQGQRELLMMKGTIHKERIILNLCVPSNIALNL